MIMANATFNMISLNVRGLNNLSKRKAVLRWLAKGKYDIILLQETHSTLELERVWHDDWSGPIFFSHGTSSSKGCCILIRDTLDFKPISLLAANDGRMLIIQCLVANDPVTIVNVYAPNKETDRVRFMKDLDAKMSDKGVSNLNDIIMGGDWNVIRDPELDKLGGNLNTNQNCPDQIDLLITKYNLNNTWRIKNPCTRRYTWRQSNPLIQCRLDYWLISDSLFDKVVNLDIKPSIRSDHSAITVQFEDIPCAHKGPNFWKFNSNLLKENDYMQTMRNKLKLWCEEYNIEDKRLKWEIIKFEIRKFTIEYSKRRRYEANERQKRLERQLCELERNLTTENRVSKYNEVKQELKQIGDEKINGQIIRSKVRWHEEGERSTKYFLGLEKAKAVKKHLQKLKLKDGRITTDPKEILSAQVDFYRKLYSSKLQDNPSTYNFFDHTITLNDVDRDDCEGAITIKECEEALHTFKNDKSPGNDGITSEFYKHFWGELSHIIVDGFNFSYEKGKLATSQKQAIISLIDKGKDRLFLENWRPISLLNVDYKIASKVLAQRLHDKIPKLVSLNQTGFVKGRYMNDTIRTLHDIVDFCKFTSTEGLLLMIDFEKAFDTLEWDFLFQTLEKMNFGQSFINWVKLFYNDIESCVSNNGVSSPYFKLERGVRQGDPLSA